MNRSPLHDLNADLGARFTDFGGWEMPVQYQSVLDEHRAVRAEAGLFDVTHLGRFELSGPGARTALKTLLCNDIDRIAPGRCQYSMILNADGGIVDDLIVWWLSEDRFWVMPNAVNQARVMRAFSSQPDCEVFDLQASSVFMALQGPKALRLFEETVGAPPGRFANSEIDFAKQQIRAAGTGYTGEAGLELCAQSEVAQRLFTELVGAGAKPCGLGARDTLRLEAGLALWGQDIDETTTPFEAGLDFAVSMDHEFTGRDVLVAQKENGLKRKLTGFVLSDRGVPRHGYPVRTANGGTGSVTSGNHSPILNTGIGMAYVTPPTSPGTPLEVEIRGRWVGGLTAKPPFHVSE